MLVPMARVEVVGHLRQLDAALAALQELRLFHLTDVPGDRLGVRRLAADDAHVREAEELRFLRTRLDALIRLFPGTTSRDGPATAAELRPGPIADAEVEELRAELDRVAPRVEELVQRLDELAAEEASLPRYVASLRRLLPLVGAVGPLERFETVAILLDRRHRAVLDLLTDELAAVAGARFEVVSADVDDQTVAAALVFPRAASGAVHSLLGREQVSEVRLPARFAGLSFAEAVAAMEQRLTLLPSELDAARAEIDELHRERGEAWLAARRAVDARLAQLDAAGRLGSTRRTFVAVGWVPRRALTTLADGLTARLGSTVVVEEVEAGEGEEPPVLLANRRPARPFESLVNLVALPRQGSIDPTPLMAAFLPLFFGMMLGDVVYGAVLLGVVLALRRRFPAGILSDLTRVLTFCAAWSVVWGFVYGEALGDLGHRVIGLEPLWADRAEAIQPLLLLAVAVGAFHLVLGLVLGVWSAWRERARTQLAERAGTLVALAGLFLLAGSAAGRLPDGVVTPAVAAVVVGLVVLSFPHGPLGLLLGPVELLGAVGNILSYLRLAAIGLASVFLARVANELGAAAPLWLGLMVATLFHALNLALGTFSPTIQALRLHYVEFFTKFVEPGGQRYEPFGAPAAGS